MLAILSPAKRLVEGEELRRTDLGRIDAFEESRREARVAVVEGDVHWTALMLFARPR